VNKVIQTLLLTAGIVVATSALAQSKPEDKGLPSIPVWANPIVVPVKYNEKGGVILTATAPILTTDANSKNLGYSTLRLIGIIHFN
jgi:hypothetical protein